MIISKKYLRKLKLERHIYPFSLNQAQHFRLYFKTIRESSPESVWKGKERLANQNYRWSRLNSPSPTHACSSADCKFSDMKNMSGKLTLAGDQTYKVSLQSAINEESTNFSPQTLWLGLSIQINQTMPNGDSSVLLLLPPSSIPQNPFKHCLPMCYYCCCKKSLPCLKLNFL